MGATVLAGLVLGLLGYVALHPVDPVTGDTGLVRSDAPGLRLLFVGNRLTSSHAMTGMVRRLGEADPGAPPIYVVQYAVRGSTLQDALDDDRLRELLDGERWDDVVLQEHSQVASRPAERRAHMLPAATALERMARRAGGRTVLFMSWGYRDGDRDAVPGDTYQAMDNRLRTGFSELGSRLPVLLAPVNLAWEAALRRRPGVELWRADGRRPSHAGSYLAACVFYALLTGRDPARSRFTAGLGPAQAQSLQQIASESVRRVYP